MSRKGPLGAAAGLAVLVAGGAVGLAVLRAGQLPEGPQPVAWDREACARCRMHVGEPRFAAQLISKSGEVQHFDDPGCLLRQLDTTGAVHALYFHDATADRWLDGDAVAFLPGHTTPMGYGLGAVPRGTPGALSLAEARGRATAASAAPRPAPPESRGAPAQGASPAPPQGAPGP